MATLTMPTRTDLAIYQMSVDLEGVTFNFDFQFNRREGFWYFDLSDADGVLIRSGIKVVTELLNPIETPGFLLSEVETVDALLESLTPVTRQ